LCTGVIKQRYLSNRYKLAKGTTYEVNNRITYDAWKRNSV